MRKSVARVTHAISDAIMVYPVAGNYFTDTTDLYVPHGARSSVSDHTIVLVLILINVDRVVIFDYPIVSFGIVINRQTGCR